MASKAKAIYSGALNQTIVRRPAVGLLRDLDRSEQKQIKREIGKKLGLLFQHYKIPTTAEDRWQSLAISLAFTHVPGFAIVDPPARAGRPRRWDYNESQNLVNLIDAINAEHKRGIKDAISIAAKRHRSTLGSNLATLETRYYEAKKRLAFFRQVMDRPFGVFGAGSMLSTTEKAS